MTDNPTDEMVQEIKTLNKNVEVLNDNLVNFEKNSRQRHDELTKEVKLLSKWLQQHLPY